MNTQYEYVSRNEIERLHKGYFFSKDNLRFFNSRISQEGYRNKTTGEIYFVTSEKFQDNARLYSVRKLKLDGSIETVEEFQGYKSSLGANNAAKRLASKES